MWRNWEAKFSATVLVWEKEQSDRVESDIGDLISAHPDQKKYQALQFSLAGTFTQTREYSRAEKILKPMRETSNKQGREAILVLTLSAENEKWLGRYDRTKAYAEEALEISRREGRKRAQVEALQQAQLALAKSSAMTSSHPYFWAPFILVGDWK